MSKELINMSKRLLIVATIFSLVLGGLFSPIIPAFEFSGEDSSQLFDYQEVDAAVRVKGYYRKDGTYVRPHYRSNPDGNPYNNWSFPGNVNPYTGKVAPGNPDTYLENYYGNSGSSGGGTLQLPSYTPLKIPSINNPPNSYIYGLSWYCNSGYKKIGSTCAEINNPPNSYVYGSSWYCNSGYKKTGDACIKIDNPPNSYFYGSSWYCNSGYKKSDNTCIKINNPSNSYVYGSSWYCSSGYKKVGSSCEKINNPSNSYVYGSSWYCNSGYVKQGTQCISKSTADCIASYSSNVYGLKDSSGKTLCYCNSGFEWSTSGTACVQKNLVINTPVVQKSSGTTVAQLQNQINALLAQIEALQRLLAASASTQ